MEKDNLRMNYRAGSRLDWTPTLNREVLTGDELQVGCLQRIADAVEKIIPGFDRAFDRLTAATAQASLEISRLGEQLRAAKAENAKLKASNGRLRRAARKASQ